MTINFNTEQLKAINDYRSNGAGYVISDEAVVQLMIKDGKLPECFSTIGKPASSKPSNTRNLTVSPNTANNGTSSIFSPNVASSAPSEDVTKFTVQEFTPTMPAPLTQEEKQAKAELARQNELKELGLQNTKGKGKEIKDTKGNTYTLIGAGTNGRQIVEDGNGTIQVLSHDNILLDKDYVKKNNRADLIRSNSKNAHDAVTELLDSQIKNAQRAFDKQISEDGWAGDIADGISYLWNNDLFGGGTGNTARQVREDLETYDKNLSELKKAASEGNEKFNAEFKKMFGVNYNPNAVANYVKSPTEENYQKAFGTQNNIGQRVAKYNQSQETGAAVVKTGGKIAAGVAVSVATGGTGLVAVGAAAGATAASSVVIDTSDRLTSDVGL